MATDGDFVMTLDTGQIQPGCQIDAFVRWPLTVRSPTRLPAKAVAMTIV